MANSHSHLVLDQKAFDPDSISQATHAFNQKLMDIMATGPKWYEVGAPAYRQMRAEGKTPLPAAVLLDSAATSTIPSRDPGRSIPCRILKPTDGRPATGVFMHVHGGGWVLQNEASQDPALQRDDTRFSDFQFKGLLLHFGCYDLSFTPGVKNFQKPEVLVLDYDTMLHYREAFCPGMSLERIREPDLSPLYADLEKLRGRLPAALYTCGTEHPLLDDTVFMAAKWMMARGEAVVKIVPGAAHGYIFFASVPESGFEDGITATMEFIKNKLG